jgi:hypothetical protein
MDPTRADRVKEVEAFPNTRQSEVKHLQHSVLVCGKYELCLTLLAEGLQKLLPPGEILEGLVEKLQGLAGSQGYCAHKLHQSASKPAS